MTRHKPKPSKEDTVIFALFMAGESVSEIAWRLSDGTDESFRKQQDRVDRAIRNVGRSCDEGSRR
jgi:hypothetical protein